MRVLDLPECPACGGAEFLAFDLGGGSMLRRCRRCDTVSAPDYADPEDVYVDGYMFGETGAFGPPDVREPLFHEYLMQVARKRILLIERATRIVGGRILDVGCGTGEVLMAAREGGWSVQGVEPEKTAAELAHERGLPVAVAHLEESGLPEQSFDVVCAFHVLEHIPDSRGFLRTLSRWARPGGFVVIEVPNFKSVQRRRQKQHWIGYRPKEHLVHFAPETLGRTFRASGLEPASIRTPTYVGPPQTLDQALEDLQREGRFRQIVGPLTTEEHLSGESVRLPNRAAWAILRTVEAIHDRAGVGGVVLCVGRVL